MSSTEKSNYLSDRTDINQHYSAHYSAVVHVSSHTQAEYGTVVTPIQINSAKQNWSWEEADSYVWSYVCWSPLRRVRGFAYFQSVLEGMSVTGRRAPERRPSKRDSATQNVALAPIISPKVGSTVRIYWTCFWCFLIISYYVRCKTHRALFAGHVTSFWGILHVVTPTTIHQ